MGKLHPITLTFDNGPEPGITEQVLDVLAARGVAATFFLVGRKLASRAGQALAMRARAEGHLLGGHSFFHLGPLAEASAEAAAQEIDGTQELLGDLAPQRLFRPVDAEGRARPELLSRAACDLLLAGGYTCVVWNALPRDWADPLGWVRTALTQIAEHRARGVPTVLALHDLPLGAMPKLPEFLDRVANLGVRFVQTFPDEAVLIRGGRLLPGAERLIAAPTENLAAD